MSTIKAINLTHPNSPTNNLVLDNQGNMTVSGTVVGGSAMGMRNRVINGGMDIDQRNAGASVTPTNGQYTVDRWFASVSQTSKFSVQQNAGSVTPPPGFTNYLGVTSLSSYSVGSSDYFRITHAIEGLNISDFAFGSANAVSITISFWVRSSLTGTFGAHILNGTGARLYPFTYTISSSNTWERKTVAISGDTTGTWATNNTVGMFLGFSLGYGSSLSGAANAWNAGSPSMPSGSVSIVGTNGATLYITGVQLEVGTVATPFERRLYGQELALCQRYFHSTWPAGVAVGTAGGYGIWTMIETSELNRVLLSNQFPVTMRATPNMTAYSSVTGTAARWRNRSTNADVTVSTMGVNALGWLFNTLSANQTAGNQIIVCYTADAEL